MSREGLHRPGAPRDLGDNRHPRSRRDSSCCAQCGHATWSNRLIPIFFLWIHFLNKHLPSIAHTWGPPDVKIFKAYTHTPRRTQSNGVSVKTDVNKLTLQTLNMLKVYFLSCLQDGRGVVEGWKDLLTQRPRNPDWPTLAAPHLPGHSAKPEITGGLHTDPFFFS